MRKLVNILIAITLLLCFSVFAFADVHVNGYYRGNGTYVKQHSRSSPNKYRYDNYSAKGNVNPYTGRAGTQRHEYTSPPAYNKSYRRTK